MVETSDERRKRLELQDHGHELAGLETGRMTRFGVGTALAQNLKEKERTERAYRDALDRLLATDPEYRELYEELGQKLGDAETAADQTIKAIQAALQAQQDANQDMRDRAPKIDGKAVFRYADGRVVDEDGNEIDASIAAGIIWPDDAPSAEDYFAGVERADALRTSLDEWRGYRNGTLGDIRNRHEDRDNPPDKDSLKEDIDVIASGAPENLLEVVQSNAPMVPHKPSEVLIPSLTD